MTVTATMTVIVIVMVRDGIVEVERIDSMIAIITMMAGTGTVVRAGMTHAEEA